MALTEMMLSLASNPYFSAGFGLFGVGSAAAVGRAMAKVSMASFRHGRLFFSNSKKEGKLNIRLCLQNPR